jgi:uncharacterized protein
MTSNLVLWTEEIRQFVDRYGFGVLMSIDGCPDVQDGQRPSKNGQKVSSTVARWAQSMLRTRPQSTARATLHPKYVDRFAESMKYLHGLGFKEVAIANTNYAEWTPEAFAILRAQLDEVLEYIVECASRRSDFNLSVIKYYLKLLVHPRAIGTAVRRQSQPCGAGKGYLMIDHRGDIWPCHRFDGADADAKLEGQMRLGNIYQQGFDAAKQQVFLSFDHFKQHKERCNTCPVNDICGGFCPAANLSSTGSIYTPHDGFCEWSAQMYSASERLYEQLASTSSETLDFALASCDRSTSDGQK